jgi:hypothetical protein
MTNRGYQDDCDLTSLKRGRLASLSAQLASTFRWVALLSLPVALCFFLIIAGCSTSANTTTPSTPVISVAIMQAPPNSMSVGGNTSVSATVSNDVANAGVDWVAMCGSAPNCGTFSPSHTASGAVATFTAPLDVPSGNSVAVTATSATDRSKSAASSVTITSTVTGVTITKAPPANYPSGGTVSVAATVSGDPSNAGIDWKATCGTINCTSSFLGTHTAPGVPAMFVVPIPSITYPMIVGSTVTLTAYATADHNFSAFASFVVTGQISISMTKAPPSLVPINSSIPLIATVSNDPTNSGVTWTVVSCDVAPCGSWAPNGQILDATQAASGATVTYYAPPSAVNHVVIQAAATASPVNAIATAEISITAPISVALTQGVVNSTIVVNASAPLVATVSNDTSNAGVDWTVTCGSTGACGSFSPAHTASGAATTFTAPSSVPSGNAVTIAATSTADPTKSATETVTVTATIPPNSLLLGRFVMSLSGTDANGGPFTLGGVIAGDGLGDITTGSLDLVDLDSAGNVEVLPSTYTMGTDSRGQIIVKVNTATLTGNFGANNSGSITLSVVFYSPNHALLSETDAFASATGTLDLQNATDLASFAGKSLGLEGLYSLSLTGSETASPNPKYFVAGALTFSFSGTSYTEVGYITDQSDKGIITSVPHQTTSHGFTAPLPNGFGEMQLDSVNLGLPTQFNLNVWLVDQRHFVITDWRDSFAGSPPVIIIGKMVAPPDAQTISGTYTFAEMGETASPGLLPQAAGGIFSCGGAGTLDVTPLGGTPLSNQPIAATCAAPVNDRGLIGLSGSGAAGISSFAAYPAGDQGVYLIELDGGSSGTAGPSGAGVAMQQGLTLPPPAYDFSGHYASNFFSSTSSGLEAFAGRIDSDGVSAVSGTVDVNSFASTPPPVGKPSSNATLAGSYTAGANGRFPLTLAITPAAEQPAPVVTTLHPVCYLVDAAVCLLLGTDATAPGTGILQLQSSGL